MQVCLPMPKAKCLSALSLWISNWSGLEKIAGVEGILQSPETYDGDFQDDLHDLIRNQTELKTEIEEVEQTWLNLNEQLEGNS